jgi:CDP-glucose 4,6-dehydratase
MENMVNMNKSFWKDKKVFITGNTCFKGNWLTLCLDSMGSNLLGYSDKIYSHNIHDVNKTSETIIGDIRDFEKLKSSIHRFNPEIVIHFAAQSLVRESYSIPKETYEINLMHFMCPIS